jgi:chromate transport protein ChrA
MRSLLWPGYAVALLLIVFPLGDLFVNLWPIRLGDVDWRFGTVGLLAGFVLTPLLGVVALVVVAAALDHPAVLRAVSGLNLAVAVATLAMLVLFTLDWIQMRATAQPEIRPNMDVGTLKAMVKHVFSAATLGWLGLAGWRVTRPARGTRSRTRSPLIGTGKDAA